MTAPFIDIHGHIDGICLTLNGEVLTVGTWTHCTRARIEAYQAMDRLEVIFRDEKADDLRAASQ